MKIPVTGCAGFIRSAVCRHRVADKGLVNVDTLINQADIRHRSAIDAVMHLSGEGHVDQSITGTAIFLGTTVMGTTVMPGALRKGYSDKRPGCWSRPGDTGVGNRRKTCRSRATRSAPKGGIGG